jgi:hypothetical protein
MIYVVAAVVRQSKPIEKLNYFHYRGKGNNIYCACYVCVFVCVEVSWITDKSILNQNFVVVMYIAEVNKNCA